MEERDAILTHLGLDEFDKGFINEIINMNLNAHIEYMPNHEERYVYALGLIAKYSKDNGSSLETFMLKTNLDGFIGHMNQMEILKNVLGKFLKTLDSEIETIVILAKDYYANKNINE